MRIQDSFAKPVNEPWSRKSGRCEKTPDGDLAQTSDGVSLAEVHRVLTPALRARCLEQVTADVVRGDYRPPSPEVSHGIIEEHLAAI
jgi:hypothetical protein